MGYKGLQGNTRGYKGLQGITRGNSGLQGIAEVFEKKLNSNQDLILQPTF